MQINFNDSKRYEIHLYLDGANGVGAVKIENILKTIDNLTSQNETRLAVHLFNEAKQPDDILNHLVNKNKKD